MTQRNAEALILPSDELSGQQYHDYETETPATNVSSERLGLDFWWYTIIMFLVTFGCAVLGAPSPRLLEMAVCRQYLEDHNPAAIPSNGDIPESSCKSEEIQRSFTFLLTMLSTSTNLVAMLMQFPMGLLADKKSRRLALLLNITSTIMYWDWIVIVGYIYHVLPTWTLYLAPAFLLIGGGPWATGALVFAAINDKVTPQQRTMAFSLMEAVSGIADLLGSGVGVWTMSHQLSIPYLIATISFVWMYIPTIVVAENRGREPLGVSATEPGPSEIQPLLQDDNDCVDDASHAPSPPPEKFGHSKMIIFAICFGSFFLIYTSRDSLNFVIPWVSYHFEQPMARAGLLFSLRALISTILYLAILPIISTFISRKSKLSAAARDLILSKWSVFLIAAGSFLVAFAPSLWLLVVGFSITTLGSCASITLRSYLASSIDSAFSGRLYTAISTVGTLGGLLGMPIMGAAYSWGLEHRTWNVAPPFVVAGVFNVTVLVFLLFFGSLNKI